MPTWINFRGLSQGPFAMLTPQAGTKNPALINFLRKDKNMKKTEIELNGVYANGKEGSHCQERTVIDMGPHYLLYSGQGDTDCLRFKVTKGWNLNRSGNITRTRFAALAKARVDA